ncbi:MAG: hypothetical protein ABSG53_07880 [Thermoguttaceae bacterium]
MITTRYKEKLPGHLSYPVGLELLATELGQVPQGDKLSVSFFAHAGRVTEIEDKRRSGAYYPVLAARFHHSRLGLSEANDLREHGFYDPIWGIVVYAVGRKHRAVARTLLREQGLPAVATWLRTPRSDTWSQGRKEIVVCFNEKDQSVIVEKDAG